MSETKYCTRCRRTLNDDNFYKSRNLEKYGANGGFMTMCKKCATAHVDPWEPKTFMPLLEEIDVPYVPDEWNTTLQRKINSSAQGIVGAYIAKMNVAQWREYRFKDTDNIEKEKQRVARENYRKMGYSETEIDEIVRTGMVPKPDKPLEKMNQKELAAYNEANAPKPKDMGLTDADRKYLDSKWGSSYNEDEWVRLETQYNEMMNSYDIQTAGHKDTLKMICKSYLKANQLIDISDIEGYQKAMKVYNDLMHSGNFTAVQNKTDNGEYVDSVSELVALCESEGFIPRYYVEQPNDRIDKVILDLQGYTKNLIDNETNLDNMLEVALKQIQEDKERPTLSDDEEDDDGAIDDLFKDIEKQVHGDGASGVA